MVPVLRRVPYLVIVLWMASVAPAAEKLRVLLITGGHGYDRPAYHRVFAANPEIVVTHLEHTKDTADAWDRADLEACDVIVLYDMPRTITEAQKARFRSVFARGTGLVVTHHALCSYPDWPEYEALIGGRWSDPKLARDTKVKMPGYEHDVDIAVQVMAPGHPITAGVRDFTLNDEVYWNFRTTADITPLLRTTHPASDNPLAWVRTTGRSRVAYLQLGHGPKAYSDANYRRLLANAIRWAATGK